MSEHLLLVDDDIGMGHMLSAYFEPRGFDVLQAYTGRDGLRMAYEKHPDLVLLDITMPELDGWQVCQRLREMSDVPIVVLTAQVQEENVVKGFQLGADDYVTKPFRLSELDGRVRAVLRRVRRALNQEESGTIFDDGTLRIDLERQEAWRCGAPVRLTPTEFRLLRELVRRQGMVVPHRELLTQVWGPAYAEANSCLSLYIRYIREKLEENPKQPQYIQTRWGIGYQFAATG